MVLNHSCSEQFFWDRLRKLKHLTLSGVYHKQIIAMFVVLELLITKKKFEI